MASKFGALPGPQILHNLSTQGLHLIVKLLQVPPGDTVVAGYGLKLLDLLLDTFEFLLGFFGSFHGFQLNPPDGRSRTRTILLPVSRKHGPVGHYSLPAP